ncbi:hypothetical protein HJ192_11440 [Vibrio parahaemolyticus]|nr:hypothetical protein [Vibrio parahaemolyticus]
MYFFYYGDQESYGNPKLAAIPVVDGSGGNLLKGGFTTDNSRFIFDGVDILMPKKVDENADYSTLVHQTCLFKREAYTTFDLIIRWSEVLLGDFALVRLPSGTQFSRTAIWQSTIGLNPERTVVKNSDAGALLLLEEGNTLFSATAVTLSDSLAWSDILRGNKVKDASGAITNWVVNVDISEAV